MAAPGQAGDTLWVDLSVDVPLLMSHPKTALLTLLQKLQGWQSAIEDDITVEQFSGAMTNMVYRCGLLQAGREVQVVLMRVHASSSDLFDRQTEIDTFKGVSQAGLGPQLLLLFRNGRVEEFLSQHVTLAASDIHDPAVSAAIAATLATFHTKMSKVMAAGKQQAATVQLWERLRLWLDLVQQVTTLSELQQLGMDNLDQEIQALEQQLTHQHPCWVALCHNDLQYGNIMARVGAATASGDGSTAAGPDAASSSSSLAQQLHAIDLQAASPGAAGAAAAAVGTSPRQQLLQPAAAAKLDSNSLAAGLSPGKQAGPGSWLSDDASLSNVSVAGSTAPSVSGLSVYSASTSAAGTATAAATAAPAASPPPAHAQSAPAAVGSTAPAAAGGVAAAGAVTVPSNTRLAELSASASSSSLQVLGRSPARTVQLPDGSLVLPGMRARPRGQSPEPVRGKRPDASEGSFTGSLGGGSMPDMQGWPRAGSAPPAAAGAGSAAAAAPAGAGAAAAGSQSSSRLGQVPAELQPPSAAAVLRHAGSDKGGELLLQLMPEDPEAVAEAGMTRRRRISQADGPSTTSHRAAGSSSKGLESESDSSSSSDSDSSSDTTSAADSAEAEDLLLVPQHLQRPARRQQQQGAAGSGRAAGGLVAERVAAVSRSARKYREVRRARLRPAEGLEFPALTTSDPENSGGSFSDSSGLSDDSPTHHSRGRSPPSRFNKAAAPAETSPAAAGAAAAAFSSPVAAAVTAAAGADDADGGSACITFIDYEYSGFNPVAYDIANHWCEWAADYHTETPHVLDFGRLPDKQQQLLFVEAYLSALLAKLGVQVPQPAAGLGSAAAGDGGSSCGADRAGVTAAAAPGSPEAATLSSLAGFALASRQQNADSGHRSEPAWSTLSSRGAESVISFPETDAGWETASQSSVVTTQSHKAEVEDGGAAAAAAAGSAAAAGVPAGAASAADGVRAVQQPSSSDLCDIWCWLEHATGLGTGSHGSSGGQLSAAAWQQLVQQVVSAADTYMAASHLLWALWGVIQAKVSDVDFDFTGYGQQRWRMYLQTRPAAAAQRKQQ